jgi:TIR domain
MLKPVGFWSYARQDDKDADGQISNLRRVLCNAINLRLGCEVKLFQDIEAIRFGMDWASAIEEALENVSFFIPVVTPRFLQSENCRQEFTTFRSRMSAMRRDDLIFPIHYVDVDKTIPAESTFEEVLAALRRHQWIDFRSLQCEDLRCSQVKQWAAGLALAIVEASRGRRENSNMRNSRSLRVLRH